MAKHDGCLNCGNDEQEILSSRTVTVISMKKNRKTGVLEVFRAIASVALCKACEHLSIIDTRTSKGSTVGV